MPKPEQVTGFYQRLLDRLAHLPGRRPASPPCRACRRTGRSTPTTWTSRAFRGEDRANRAAAQRRLLAVRQPRLLPDDGHPPGRRALLRAHRRHGARPGVVVINQTMAKLFWPNRSPLGERIKSPDDKRPLADDRRRRRGRQAGGARPQDRHRGLLPARPGAGERRRRAADDVPRAAHPARPDEPRRRRADRDPAPRPDAAGGQRAADDEGGLRVGGAAALRRLPGADLRRRGADPRRDRHLRRAGLHGGAADPGDRRAAWPSARRRSRCCR